MASNKQSVLWGAGEDLPLFTAPSRPARSEWHTGYSSGDGLSAIFGRGPWAALGQPIEVSDQFDPRRGPYLMLAGEIKDTAGGGQILLAYQVISPVDWTGKPYVAGGSLQELKIAGNQFRILPLPKVKPEQFHAWLNEHASLKRNPSSGAKQRARGTRSGRVITLGERMSAGKVWEQNMRSASATRAQIRAEKAREFPRPLGTLLTYHRGRVEDASFSRPQLPNPTPRRKIPAKLSGLTFEQLHEIEHNAINDYGVGSPQVNRVRQAQDQWRRAHGKDPIFTWGKRKRNPAGEWVILIEGPWGYTLHSRHPNEEAADAATYALIDRLPGLQTGHTGSITIEADDAIDQGYDLELHPQDLARALKAARKKGYSQTRR